MGEAEMRETTAKEIRFGTGTSVEVKEMRKIARDNTSVERSELVDSLEHIGEGEVNITVDERKIEASTVNVEEFECIGEIVRSECLCFQDVVPFQGTLAKMPTGDVREINGLRAAYYTPVLLHSVDMLLKPGDVVRNKNGDWYEVVAESSGIGFVIGGRAYAAVPVQRSMPRPTMEDMGGEQSEV